MSVGQRNKTIFICPTLLGLSYDVDKVGGPFGTHGFLWTTRKNDVGVCRCIILYRQEVERRCGLHLCDSG